jgi:hypothetical protein
MSLLFDERSDLQIKPTRSLGRLPCLKALPIRSMGDKLHGFNHRPGSFLVYFSATDSRGRSQFVLRRSFRTAGRATSDIDFVITLRNRGPLSEQRTLCPSTSHFEEGLSLILRLSAIGPPKALVRQL